LKADTPPNPQSDGGTGHPLWLPELMPGGGGVGFLEKSRLHSLMFVRRRAKALLVSFDNLADVNDRSALRVPWGYKFARDRDASHLGVFAHKPFWYRDPGLIARLERLAADGFFEGYGRVLFAGVSMGGFGALTFSRLVPGAHVLAIDPQSTLDEALVPWEERYERGRKQDWSLAYGDAANQLATAACVNVLYDPHIEPDRRHFERLRGASVTGLKCWFGNHKTAVFLRRMDLLKPVMEAALFDELTPALFYRLYRKRQVMPWYTRKLLRRCKAQGHPGLADRVARVRDCAQARAAAE